MFQQSNGVHFQDPEPRRKEYHLELRDYMRILAKNWLLVIGGIVLGVALAVVATLSMNPKYESTSTLYVSVRTGMADATGDLYQGASFAQTAVTSYVDVATSALVLDRVADDLSTDLTTGQLRKMLTVTSPPESVLIKITAANPNPQLAAEIANTTGEKFTRVVENEIEITGRSGDSPVQVRTIDPGVVPVEPSSPNMLLNIALGLILGAILGIGLAMLRGLMDTRLHTVADVEQLSEIPVVGRIAHDDHISQRPLIVHDEPRSPRAEAFRTLRTNLQFLGAGDGTRTFVVTSAMPNEGKTHVVANLAVVLAESGARVALIEADLRKPRLARVMGIEGAAGLSDVLIGRAELADVIQPWGTENLTVLPAGQIPPNPSELLGSAAMRRTIHKMAEYADYVLIDAPPILPVTDAAVISGLTSGALLVASVGNTTRQDFSHAINSLETVEGRLLGVIVNNVSPKSSDISGYTSYRYGDLDKADKVKTTRPA